MADVNIYKEECSKKFYDLCSTLTTVVHGRSEGDKQRVNALLDQLNSLNFKNPFVQNIEKALLVINQCCNIIPSNDTFLVAKGCQLFRKLIIKQQVKVEGKTLSLAVNWCLEALKYCADIAILDVLCALEVLLQGNGHNLKHKYDLFDENGILMLLADPEDNAATNKLSVTSVWDVRLFALRCLQAATYLQESSISDHECSLDIIQLEKLANIFFKHLNIHKEDQNEIVYPQLLATALKGLQNVYCQSKELLYKFEGVTFGIIKAYMLFGLPGHVGLRPQKVFPTVLAQSDIKQSAANITRSGKNFKVKLRNPKHSRKTESRHKDIDNDDWRDTFGASVDGVESPASVIKTSESDFSDSESGQALKLRYFQGKVRQGALCLLQTVIKIMDKKQFFGYLSSLLPDGSTQTRTLMTCLLRDPSPQCRLEVINCLVFLFLGSKTYFLQAERRQKCTSFTPYSETLGSIIEELHRCMCLALSAENSVSVIIQLLKCMARLVQNTPYHRLSQGLITKVIRNVRAYLRHKDWNVQVVSLTVLQSIISLKPSIPEITEILKKPYRIKCQPTLFSAPDVTNIDNEMKDSKMAKDVLESNELDEDTEMGELHTANQQKRLTDEPSWLLVTCLDNIGIHQKSFHESSSAEILEENCVWGVCPVTVRVESFQVISSLCRSYFSLLVLPQLQLIIEAVELGFKDTDTAVLLHSGKLIEAIGYGLLQCLKEEEGKHISLAEVTNFWRIMISGPLRNLVQRMDEASLRTAGCDCLTNLPSDVFELLPREEQIFIATLLLGCSKDEECNVKAAALRALGVYVLYPILRQDVQFLIDTSETLIEALNDGNVGVRTNASWSLSNVSDAIVLNESDEQAERIPETLYISLLDFSLKAARDNEKVRSSGVRAAGNLLLILRNESLSGQTVKTKVEDAILALIHSASFGNNMKIRWNACYAIGNVLRNELMYSTPLLATIFSTLSELVKNFRNFKVRISAAAALSAPATRQLYGNYYLPTWSALITALENSHNMEDYNEYQHQDNLVYQICFTLIHLTSLVTETDLVPLEDILAFNTDILHQSILKFQRNTVPEKTAALVTAGNHVTSFFQRPGLTTDQLRSASLLTTIFMPESNIF